MSVADAFWAAPPISRTITAATVLISIPGHLGLYNLAWVVFFRDYVITFRQIPQIWRALTCFCITGPQLGMIFDPFLLYNYSSQLETGSTRFQRPGSYFIYLVFVSLVILITGGFFLNGMVLLPALNMAIMYIYAQEDPNRQVVLFVLPMPAKYLPYASLVLTYIMAGPQLVYIQSTGILAGHAYHFLDRIWPQFGGGSHLISTPEIVEKWFTSLSGGRARNTSGFTVQTPARPAGGNRGTASGFSSGTFGTGRRLGGS